MDACTASEIIHGFFCSQCDDDRIERETRVFCADCKTYLCEECHKRRDVAAGESKHAILSKKTFGETSTLAHCDRNAELGTEAGIKDTGDLNNRMLELQIESDDADAISTNRDESKEEYTVEAAIAANKVDVQPDRKEYSVEMLMYKYCPLHTGRHVDRYCQDHDFVGCNTCMDSEHWFCRQTFPIEDIVDVLERDEIFNGAIEDITLYADKMMTLKHGLYQRKSSIDIKQNKCLDDITERRKEIDEYLNKLQEEQEDAVRRKYIEMSDAVYNGILLCEESIAQWNGVKGRIQKMSNTMTSQQFVYIKRIKQQLNISKKELQSYRSKSNNAESLTIEVDCSIEDALSLETLFGRVRCSPGPATQLEFVEDVNILMHSSDIQCEPYDICQLSDGTIILTDWNNAKVKTLVYDATYKVHDSLTLSHMPWGVCCVDENRVAVTVPKNRQILDVGVNPKVFIRNSFNVNFMCQGIACSDKRLYVAYSDYPYIEVFDFKGRLLQKFQKELRNPLSLLAMPDNDQIAVADGDLGLILMDKSGNMVTSYTYPNRQMTCGSCVDDDGNLFVADCGSRQIAVIGTDISCLVLLSDMDKTPRAVHFDTYTKRVIVMFDNCDYIRVYSPRCGTRNRTTRSSTRKEPWFIPLYSS